MFNMFLKGYPLEAKTAPSLFWKTNDKSEIQIDITFLIIGIF